MKVLVAHNYYQSASPSGENLAVDEEAAALRALGHDVLLYRRSSDEIRQSMGGSLRAGIGALYSRRAVREIESHILNFKPDVIHLHNVFPLISPAVIDVAKRLQVPIVQTIHNYRHSCVAGMHMRGGRVCLSCVDGSRWSAVRNSCYRGSSLQSIPMVASQVAYSSIWRDLNAYFVLTPFMRDHLAMVGFPKERLVYRPTWTHDPGSLPQRLTSTGIFTFVGRLDLAKGIEDVLGAWSVAKPRDGRLVVAGDGPLRQIVLDAAASDPSITYEGRVGPDRVSELLDSSDALLSPSRWFEGFPRTLSEAFARGVPAIVSDLGGPGSIVTPEIGWKVIPGITEMAQILKSWDPTTAAVKGLRARQYYEENLTPKCAMEILVRTYRIVVQ